MTIGSVLPVVSSVDEALRRRGATRTIGVRVPSVLGALHLAADTDLAATSFARIVPHLRGRVVAHRLPFAVPPLDLHLAWHPRNTTEPFHRWIRETITAAVPGAPVRSYGRKC